MKPGRRKLSVPRESIRTLTVTEMGEAAGAYTSRLSADPRMCSSASQFSACCPYTLNLVCGGHSETC